MTDDVKQDEVKPVEQPKAETVTAKQEERETGQTFTQEQVNSFMATERKEATAKLLKELGVEKPEDVKAALAELNERKTAEMSATEKLQAENERLRAEAETAKLSAVKAQRDGQVIDKASQLEIENPADALALIGNAEDTDAALDQLAKDKPYLLKTNKAPRLSANKTLAGSSQEETREERLKRLRIG